LMPQVVKPRVYFAVLSHRAKIKVVELLTALRYEGVEAIMGFGDRSLKAQLREANRRQINYVVIIGDDELNQEIGQVKNMMESTQKAISFNRLVSFFKKECEHPAK